MIPFYFTIKKLAKWASLVHQVVIGLKFNGKTNDFLSYDLCFSFLISEQIKAIKFGLGILQICLLFSFSIHFQLLTYSISKHV